MRSLVWLDVLIYRKCLMHEEWACLLLYLGTHHYGLEASRVQAPGTALTLSAQLLIFNFAHSFDMRV